jgi:hypothetical protein
MPQAAKASDDNTFIGVDFKDSEWHASAVIGSKKIHLGSYPSARTAAVARDMELLRSLGEEAADDLNFGYDVVSSTSTELVVIDSGGAKINVSLSGEKEYVPIQAPTGRKPPSREVVTASAALPRVWPLQSYNCQAWAARTQTASQVAAAFSYEIKFPFQTSLGLNLKPHSMAYSQAGGGKFVGCLTVVDAATSLASVIHPGDILLKVNDTELVLPGHLFDFERATRAITQASTPRVLRLLRPYCPSIAPSPVEMFALAREAAPIAKFHVVAHGDNPQDRTLQLTYADSQMPAAIKRNLQGPELPYNHSGMPNPPNKPPKTSFHAAPPGQAEAKVLDGEESYLVVGTIFRERSYTPGGPGADAFASGAGPPPNGGGLMNTVLGGLMISNSCVVAVGKWCVYVSIETVRNVVERGIEDPAPPPSGGGGFGSASASAPPSEPSRGAPDRVTQVPCNVPKRRFFVGKYDTENDAKLNMEMVSYLII